jgi:glycosyltransferase involved in cell wall biosynthesis
MVKDLTVVIPSLNEERTITFCIEKCKKVFEQLNIDGEVLVSDNGSTDNTVNIAQSAGARVVQTLEKGYGNALRFGFENAESKFIAMGDADNTYDFLELPLLWEKMSDQVDMVIGSRLKGNIEKGAMPLKNRYLGTPALTLILNILYGTRISDSQCGMRLMRKSCLDTIDFKTTGMEFASELLVEFAKHKFKIVETPISLHKDMYNRVPHLRPWRDGWRHLKFLIKSRVCK